jgi:hypothetical protein
MPDAGDLDFGTHGLTGAVARIGLNRPDKRKAISDRLSRSAARLIVRGKRRGRR